MESGVRLHALPAIAGKELGLRGAEHLYPIAAY
jgi:hypothetical protein